VGWSAGLLVGWFAEKIYKVVFLFSTMYNEIGDSIIVNVSILQGEKGMKTSRLFNVLMALFLVLAAMASVQPAAAQNSSRPSSISLNANLDYVPGELLVQFENGSSASAYKAQASALAGQVNAQVANLNGNIALLSFDENADMNALGALAASKPGVKAVSLNYIGHIPEINGKPATGTGDKTKTQRVNHRTGEIERVDKSAYSNLRTLKKGKSTPTYPIEWSTFDTWGWDQIYTPIIWSNTVVSPQVCILDTGADILHPDLKAKVLNGKDFVNDDLIANDDNGHGTHVAGIVVANNINKIGVMGVSNGTALAVKVGHTFIYHYHLTYFRENVFSSHLTV